MIAYRIIHHIEIVREYKANSLDGALEKARKFAEMRPIGALVRSAKDVYVMELRADD